MHFPSTSPTYMYPVKKHLDILDSVNHIIHLFFFTDSPPAVTQYRSERKKEKQHSLHALRGQVILANRPFYRSSGHIEFIRFKEYYGMPREHPLSIYARFSGKKRTSLYISREKGVHYYLQTRHNDIFFPLQSFSRKT